MLKLLGGLLLTGGGLALGLGAAREMSRRVSALESWCGALELLEGELAFRLPPMPELLDTLSRRAPRPAGQAFAAALDGMERLGRLPFEEIWDTALTEHAGALREEDLEPLRRLGGILGRYGWEDQRQAAEGVRRQLADRAAQVREELRREGKAYGTLGLTLGAFLTILLL